MTEQTEANVASSQASRTTWAWLLFDGPVALLILLFGVYFIVGQRDDWSARASEFQTECTKQANLERGSVQLLTINHRLRAGLPRLADHPHDYPPPSISAEEAQVVYGCSAREERPDPTMPEASIDELFAALFAPPRTR